jgi:hypothetical protein
MKYVIQTHKQKSYGFKCVNCKQSIPEASIEIGTKHRDHCPFCLYSLHIDQDKPGDRLSLCKSKMKPIGLTFKNNSWELMIVYECLGCGELSKNRCAGDDAHFALVDIFRSSLLLMSSKLWKTVYLMKLQSVQIEIATNEQSEDVLNGIYGVGYIPPEIRNEFGISVV